MKALFYILILLFMAITGLGQVQFITKGKIEYERKINVHRLYFGGQLANLDEQVKKKIPQFRVDYFDLVFNEEKSLYKPGRESGEEQKNLFYMPSTNNVVYKDFARQQEVSQKQLFETQFLIADSLRKLEWKIQDETRTIAGFECRKAVGRICDSVVVVAFYTDEIIPANGPESFHGLPGMILGLAIPRLYTTWFATRLVLISEAEEQAIAAPAKGKKTNSEGLIKQIQDIMQHWGDDYRNRSMWIFSL